MNETTAPASAEPQEITVRLDIKVKMAGDLESLSTVVDWAKALIVEGRKLGEVEATAISGRNKFKIV